MTWTFAPPANHFPNRTLRPHYPQPPDTSGQLKLPHISLPPKPPTGDRRSKEARDASAASTYHLPQLGHPPKTPAGRRTGSPTSRQIHLPQVTIIPTDKHAKEGRETNASMISYHLPQLPHPNHSPRTGSPRQKPRSARATTILPPLQPSNRQHVRPQQSSHGHRPPTHGSSNQSRPTTSLRSLTIDSRRNTNRVPSGRGQYTSYLDTYVLDTDASNTLPPLPTLSPEIRRPPTSQKRASTVKLPPVQERRR